MVVNPARRALEKKIASARSIERKLQAEWAKLGLANGADVQKKAEATKAIQVHQAQLAQLREQHKTTPKNVPISSLPQAERPTQLLPLNKMLSDTVKMIAYRAETALVGLLKQHLTKEDEARALIRELFVSSADIAPDDVAKTLTIRIHRMANPAHDKAIAALLEEITQQEFQHPETGAKMIFALV